MDSYIKTVTLDVDAVNNFNIITAKQGDKVNRKLTIMLKKEGVEFTPSGVSNIQFRCQKPDGNAVILDSSSGGVTAASNGQYTVTLSEQCLIVDGRALCDIAFLDSSGNTLSSASFYMDIIPMPDLTSGEDSVTQWLRLQEAIDTAEHLEENITFRTSNSYIQFSTDDGTTWSNLCYTYEVGGSSNLFERLITDTLLTEGSTVYNGRTVDRHGRYFTITRTGSGSTHCTHALTGAAVYEAGNVTVDTILKLTNFYNNGAFVNLQNNTVTFFGLKAISLHFKVTGTLSSSGYFVVATVTEDGEGNPVSFNYQVSDLAATYYLWTGEMVLSDEIVTDILHQKKLFIGYDCTGSYTSARASCNVEIFFEVSTTNPSVICPTTWYRGSATGTGDAVAIATKAYAVNEFITDGVCLYKVTAPIANGAKAIEGTNVVKTNVCAELTALLNR